MFKNHFSHPVVFKSLLTFVFRNLPKKITKNKREKTLGTRLVSVPELYFLRNKVYLKTSLPGLLVVMNLCLNLAWLNETWQSKILRE